MTDNSPGTNVINEIRRKKEWMKRNWTSRGRIDFAWTWNTRWVYLLWRISFCRWRRFLSHGIEWWLRLRIIYFLVLLEPIDFRWSLSSIIIRAIYTWTDIQSFLLSHPPVLLLLFFMGTTKINNMLESLRQKGQPNFRTHGSTFSWIGKDDRKARKLTAAWQMNTTWRERAYESIAAFLNIGSRVGIIDVECLSRVM